MRMPSEKEVAAFQGKVLSFYAEKGRDLPWRHTTDPYRILLSEVMLQQTQVDRVIGYYTRWLRLWPTARDLAAAPRDAVLREWMGLGYNNRAVRLHEACKAICERFHCDVLAALSHHKELPGIGPYTASAVRIFSANEDVVTVDTNIRRILIHEFGLDEKAADRELWEVAQRCLPRGRSCEWHNALMDYGALHLTSRKTGIKPRTRQSRFEGSDRQVRAAILRFLLTDAGKGTYHAEALAGAAGQGVDRERFAIILDSMARDGLLSRGKRGYSLT